MKKRIAAILLVLVSVFGLFPASDVAAVNVEDAAIIKQAAQNLVNNYAAQVNVADAADEAFEDFFIRAFWGGSSDVILREGDPMVAALFNSNVMKETLVETIYRSIVKMQEMNLSELYAAGGPSWHNYGYSYSMYAYRSASDYIPSKDGTPVLSNQNSKIGTVATPKNNYGTDAATKTSLYKGSVNRNDDVMELLTGGLNLKMNFVRTAVSENSATYSIELRTYDDFDFNSDYYTISKKGFNTAKDQRLKNLGVLMTIMGLDTFYWEFSKNFTIEVPYNCDHSGNSFHWIYDAENHILNSDTSNGYAQGGVSRKEYVSSTTGDVSYYFKLDEPIILAHNKPWVVEYDMKGVTSLAFSTLSSMSNTLPSLLQYTRYNTWIYSYEVTQVEKGKGATDTLTHYIGVEMKDQFKYSSKHIYSFRIENVLSEDGSNMIYVSVYDNDLGETVFGPAAMTNHWTKAKAEKQRSLRAEPSYKANGLDFIINYIGNSSYRLTHKYLDIRIYENGKDQLDSSRFVESYIAPSCTASGGTILSCTDCGYSYVAVPEAALGHSFGEYISDGNFTCTADGTKSAICSVCGYKDTVTDVGSAPGHAYSAVITEPNCTEGGYTTHTCHCGDTYTDNHTDALGHVWSEGTVTQRPVTGSDGVMSFSCERCGELRTDSIPAIPTAGFIDVTENDYFYEPVCWAADKKITSGVSADSFAPANGCTRAQVVTFLWRAAGEPAPQSSENPFTDVAEGQYYYDAVLWALENGITTGVSADSFGPNENCNRGQIVTFLWRAAGKIAAGGDTNPFEDVSGEQYYYDAVLWAVEKGITTGVSEKSFAPNATCTRGQIVTFLYRAYN